MARDESLGQTAPVAVAITPMHNDGPDPLIGTADEVADMMLACTLPKPRWTHEAHVLACVSLTLRYGAAEALGLLRTAIPRYNNSTGIHNTTTSGYHDTLTVYYVWAVDRLLERRSRIDAVLADDAVDRRAALAWWDSATLFSVAARAHFVTPNLTGDGGAVPSEPVAHGAY